MNCLSLRLGSRRNHSDWRAYAIVVLTATRTGMARLVVFGDSGLFRWFGLPSIYGAPERG